MEQIKIEWQGNTLGAGGKWHATATVERREGPPPDDTYGADGDTPLEAVTELARVLAKVVGYERSHAHRLRGRSAQGNVRGVTDPKSFVHIGEPCLDCGKAVVWYADAESGEGLDRIDLWMRVSDNNAVYFLCPTCFILRAEAKGISEIWRLTPTLGTALKGKSPQ